MKFRQFIQIGLLLGCLNLTGFAVFAQIDPQFTQYVFNPIFLNPAATGLGGQTAITAIYRTQWTGYSPTFDVGGAPTTQQLSVSVPFQLLRGGLGLYLSNDKIGGGNYNRELTASYAFHKRLGVNILAFGVSAGVYNRSLNGANYRPREENDPSIPDNKVNQLLPDFSAGVYLSNPGYELGLALKHINQPAFGFSTQSGKNILPRTVNFSGNMLIGVTYMLDISPMFVVKSDFKTVSPEAGVLVTYNSWVWAGVNYRWQDAASVIAGTKILNNKLRIGYAFDYITFGEKAKAPASHEILLTYFLNPLRNGKRSIIRTPRYRY